MKRQRLYTFTNRVGPNSTVSGTTNTTQFSWWMTTQRPNPFHGTDRLIFAVDEWGHRNLGRLHRPLLGWLCDRWERRNGGPA